MMMFENLKSMNIDEFASWFEVKLNPNSTDIEMLNNIVEIRGIENHMLIHLSDNDYQMLAAFMR